MAQTMVEQSAPELNGRITVMPKQYMPARKQSLPMGKILMVLGVLALVGIIVAMIAFFILSARPQTPQAPIVEVPMAPIQEEPQPSPTEPETPITEEEPTVEDQPVAGVPIEFVLPSLATALRLDVDTDKDGLTDVEESLFATSAAVPDTDTDSFLDGQEVLNLYDPATAGALLEVSPQIKIGRNDSQSYQFLLPLSWTATKNTPRGEEMLVRPADGDETLVITVLENPDRLSASEWYQRNADVVDFTRFTNFSNEAGWSGIQSQDKSLVMATFGQDEAGARAFLFVMHYNPGTSSSMRFPSIWGMILNSLAILEPETP